MSTAMLSATRVEEAFTDSCAKVSISGSGLHLTVTEQLANHRQALPERQCPRGEAVTQGHGFSRPRIPRACEPLSTACSSSRGVRSLRARRLPTDCRDDAELSPALALRGR